MTGAGTVLPTGVVNFLEGTTSLGCGTWNARGAINFVIR